MPSVARGVGRRRGHAPMPGWRRGSSHSGITQRHNKPAPFLSFTRRGPCARCATCFVSLTTSSTLQLPWPSCQAYKWKEMSGNGAVSRSMRNSNRYLPSQECHCIAGFLLSSISVHTELALSLSHVRVDEGNDMGLVEVPAPWPAGLIFEFRSSRMEHAGRGTTLQRGSQDGEETDSKWWSWERKASREGIEKKKRKGK